MITLKVGDMIFKRHGNLRDRAKKILTENGHDVDRSSVQVFFDENEEIYEIAKQPLFNWITEGEMSCPLERGVILDMAQIFYTYLNYKTNVVKAYGMLSRAQESYHGLQFTLEAYIKVVNKGGKGSSICYVSMFLSFLHRSPLCCKQ